MYKIKTTLGVEYHYDSRIAEERYVDGCYWDWLKEIKSWAGDIVSIEKVD